MEQETWGLEKQLHTFLFSALHGGQWSASCHGHFTTSERSLKYTQQFTGHTLHSLDPESIITFCLKKACSNKTCSFDIHGNPIWFWNRNILLFCHLHKINCPSFITMAWHFSYQFLFHLHAWGSGLNHSSSDWDLIFCIKYTYKRYKIYDVSLTTNSPKYLILLFVFIMLHS